MRLLLFLLGAWCASALVRAGEITVGDRQTVAAAPGKLFSLPRLVRAANGDYLLFFRSGETRMSDRGMVALVTSRDGRAWSKVRVLEAAPEPDHGWHNPVALVTPAGRILLWTSSLQVTPPNRRHPIYLRWSDDHGRTWTDPGRFENSGERSTYYITDAINVDDGILATAATFPPGGMGNCYTVVWHSPDGGRNWNVRSTLTRPIDNRGDEAALLETAPGELLCLLRMRRGRGLAQFRSTDAGRSWTEAQNLYGALGCTLQRPFLTRLSRTRVLLSGRDVEHKQVVAYLSEDNGKTFGGRAVIDSYVVDGGHTACFATGPAAALMAYYTDSAAGLARAVVRVTRLSVK